MWNMKSGICKMLFAIKLFARLQAQGQLTHVKRFAGRQFDCGNEENLFIF
jgi:hypothetical protein